MPLRLNTTPGIVNLFRFDVPTLTSSAEVKDNFYSQLDSAMHQVLDNEHLMLLSGFSR